jgi:hypothetical protein
MLREVRGTFRGTPYVVRLVSHRSSDMLDSWSGTEWEIDSEAVEVIAFPAYAGDTEAGVRTEAEQILAMLLEARTLGSCESA